MRVSVWLAGEFIDTLSIEDVRAEDAVVMIKDDHNIVWTVLRSDWQSRKTLGVLETNGLLEAKVARLRVRVHEAESALAKHRAEDNS